MGITSRTIAKLFRKIRGTMWASFSYSALFLDVTHHNRVRSSLMPSKEANLHTFIIDCKNGGVRARSRDSFYLQLTVKRQPEAGRPVRGQQR